MVGGISNVKIRRKAYRFEVRKRYQSSRHYRIKARPPIERIKDQVKLLLAPKKGKEKAGSATGTLASEAAHPSGGFNYVVFGAAILIAFIVASIGWIYITMQFFPEAEGTLSALEKPTIDNTVISGDILTAGERGSDEHVAEVLVDYKTQNLKNYTVRLTTYRDKLPSEVFVLNSQREDAETYPDFLRILRANLAKRQVLINEITIKQLETLPQGAVILVPSGIVPKELIGIDSLINMDKLADRGMVVIYIGQPFTEVFNGTRGTAPTPTAVLQTLPVSFDSSASFGEQKTLHLYQPLYRTVSRGAGWSNGMIFDSVSLMKKKDGAFLFVPQTLDAGWRNNYTSAADDIAKIIFETPWAEADGPAREYVFANQTDYSGARYFFSDPFEGKVATVKLEFIGYSATSSIPAMETLITRVGKSTLGELYIEGGTKIVPTSITNERIRFNGRLQETAPGQPNMMLTIINATGSETASIPQGNMNVQTESSFDIPIDADKGEYIAGLVDDNGKVYAQTYMKVVSIDIKYKGYLTQKKSVYLFDITMDGNPVKLRDLKVVVDKGQYGTYQFTDVSTVSIDFNKYTSGEPLPVGKHTFEFTAGGLKVMVPVTQVKAQTIFSDPLLWAVIILTGGIVAAGLFFAREERTYFAIDIPDFPPVARTRIALPADTVLSIFEKVNETYRWQNTPLTPAEVKNGFREIFYKGKPVYVSDYNIDYLLEELEKKGAVKEALGYFGLGGWEEKTNRTMCYLAMLRRLRDICVNNAVPFTSLGESKVADSEIIIAEQQMFLHFFDKDQDQKELLKRAIATISKGISIIVFKTENEKVKFQEELYSPSVAPTILKMESENGSLQLLTFEELEKTLAEFKML